MPVARFQMPDGRIARFEVPEGTTPEAAQANFEAFMRSQETPQDSFMAGDVPPATGPLSLAKSKPFSEAPQQGAGDDLKRLGASFAGPAVGTGEALLSAGTGLLGTAAAGVNAVGRTFMGQDPGQVAERIGAEQAGATYVPRTQPGQQAAAGVGQAMELFERGVDAVSGEPVRRGLEALGASPDVQATGATVARMIPETALAVMGGPRVAKAATPKPRPEPQVPKTKISETPVESLRAAGFKFRPSDVRIIEPGRKQTGASVAERVGGSESLRKSLLLKNQDRATKLGIEDLDLPKDTVRITPKTLDNIRSPEIAVYNEVGAAAGKFAPSPEFGAALDNISKKLGLDPEARQRIAANVEQYRLPELTGPDAVKTISTLRRRAAKQQQAKDVALQDLGDANRAIADAMEAELGRQVASGPNQGLLPRFQAAREKLAKIHNVESATVNGQIDAAILKRFRDRGVPLSGKLAIIADAAEFLPNVTKHSRTVTSMGDEGVLARMGEVATAGVRKALESDRFQNRFGQEAPALGPGSGLSDYFRPPRKMPEPEAPPVNEVPPSQAVSQRRAQQLAGDLELQPEPFPNAVEAAPTRARPTDLTLADDFVPEGMPFRAERTLADDLAGDIALAPEEGRSGIPFTPSASPRAAGMAQDVPGTSLHPELRAARGRPDEVVGELSLADELAPETRGAEVVESATRPGFFEIRTPGETSATLIKGEQAALDLAQELGISPKRPATRPPALRTSIATKTDKPKVTVRKGEGSERIVESDVGKITLYERGGAWQITDSIVDEASRGKGHGVALMEAAIREAKGKPIHSDTKVSASAARLYDSLEKRGYQVKRNEFEKDADGNLVSTNSLRPVFEVRPKKGGPNES